MLKLKIEFYVYNWTENGIKLVIQVNLIVQLSHVKVFHFLIENFAHISLPNQNIPGVTKSFLRGEASIFLH